MKFEMYHKSVKNQICYFVTNWDIFLYVCTCIFGNDNDTCIKTVNEDPPVS